MKKFLSKVRIISHHMFYREVTTAKPKVIYDATALQFVFSIMLFFILDSGLLAKSVYGIYPKCTFK